MSLTHLGWYGNAGEFRIEFANGRVTITVTDKRYPNTRRAGVVLENDRFRAIGETMIQIAAGVDLEKLEVPLANSRGHSMEETK